MDKTLEAESLCYICCVFVEGGFRWCERCASGDVILPIPTEELGLVPESVWSIAQPDLRRQIRAATKEK